MVQDIVQFSNPYIIAEIGVNHNGRLDLAKELIEAAQSAGADCVKFQTFRAERVVRKETKKADYQQDNLNNQQSQRKMLKKLELARDEYRLLKEYTEEGGLDFLSTPYNKEDVEFLYEMDVDAFKLASIHVAEPEIIRFASEFGKPIFLSTGMASLSEVARAVEILEESDSPYLLMQCTSDYPADESESNVAVIETYKNSFGCPVGFSDHTTSEFAACAAVSLGAKVIEKHFTLDKSLEGPDHQASANPTEFKNYVKALRRTESVLGSGNKKPTISERDNIDEMRRSIVAKTPIQSGETLEDSHVTFKRPGTGLPAKFYDSVVGREAVKD
ncbi:MAG: N-acetylneuraminate synthase family protein, partial [bacterium]